MLTTDEENKYYAKLSKDISDICKAHFLQIKTDHEDIHSRELFKICISSIICVISNIVSNFVDRDRLNDEYIEMMIENIKKSLRIGIKEILEEKNVNWTSKTNS